MSKRYAERAAAGSANKRARGSKNKQNIEFARQEKAKRKAHGTLGVAGAGSRRGDAATRAYIEAEKLQRAASRGGESERDAIAKDRARDMGLVDEYGEDAMKARSFATGRKGFKVGGKAEVPVIRAPEGPTKRRPTPEEVTAGFAGDDLPLGMDELSEDIIPGKSKKKRKKPVKKNMGGMMKYGHGGKVRGCGIASQGVRKAKMVSMKGS